MMRTRQPRGRTSLAEGTDKSKGPESERTSTLVISNPDFWKSHFPTSPHLLKNFRYKKEQNIVSYVNI